LHPPRGRPPRLLPAAHPPLSNIRCYTVPDEEDLDYYEKWEEGDELYDEEEEAAAERERFLLQQEIKEELENKTGRLWSDPWDLENLLTQRIRYEDLPDWSPDKVSRISQERVQIHRDKIPTIDAIAALPLPPPPPPHPGLGQAKAFALHRKRGIYRYILDKVSAMAEPKIGAIRGLSDWQDKQDAVDELFEEIEFALADEEVILGKHPKFGSMVERALEEYLRSVQKPKEEEKAGEGADSRIVIDDSLEVPEKASSEEQQEAKSESEEPVPDAAGDAATKQDDAEAVPVFMDCFEKSDASKEDEEPAVPRILIPLAPDPKDNRVGRMVEEWELSAHKASKRIMLRQCTRQIARTLQEAEKESKAARIFVNGRQGVGKSATLASIVASARKSGYIVLYLPDGDQMHKNGFYIVPNDRRKGIFDLPILSQGVCQNLLDSHRDDLASFKADGRTLEKYFTEGQLERLSGQSEGSGMSLVDLLSHGIERKNRAPMCYSAVVDVLMNQDEKPFLMVSDEFNCYFEPGHYFHIDYDEDVKNPIPYDQISLFKPFMDAMALTARTEFDEPVEITPVLMKRGAVLVATTESCAVPRKVTEALMENAKKAAEEEETPVVFCEVPRLSAIEVDHMLANYEATGVGKLRLDRGETVMNEQEVAYLRTVSGAVPQKLLDASMLS
jgi:small subunit ribosomal protein S29